MDSSGLSRVLPWPVPVTWVHEPGDQKVKRLDLVSPAIAPPDAGVDVGATAQAPGSSVVHPSPVGRFPGSSRPCQASAKCRGHVVWYAWCCSAPVPAFLPSSILPPAGDTEQTPGSLATATQHDAQRLVGIETSSPQLNDEQRYWAANARGPIRPLEGFIGCRGAACLMRCFAERPAGAVGGDDGASICHACLSLCRHPAVDWR